MAREYQKMLKRYRFLLVVAAIGVVAVCLNESSEPPLDEPGRYYDANYGFSIKFPAGWEIESDWDDEAWTVTSSDSSQYDAPYATSVRVSVEELPYKMRTDFFHEQVMEQAKNLYDDLVELETREIDASGKEATCSVMSYVVDGYPVMSVWYVVTDGHKGYLVIGMASQQHFAPSRRMLEEAALSFRLG